MKDETKQSENGLCCLDSSFILPTSSFGEAGRQVTEGMRKSRHQERLTGATGAVLPAGNDPGTVSAFWVFG
jgi:hypothetical protein